MAIVNVDLSEYGKCITLTEPQVIALQLVRNIKDMAKIQERKRLAYLKARQCGYSNMVRLTKLKDMYLSEAKLNWVQKELLQKLQDAAEHHKRLVLLKGRRVN